MRQLVLVNLDAKEDATPSQKEYRLGFWDEKNKLWQLNDFAATELVALIEDIGWLDVETTSSSTVQCQEWTSPVPRMEILVR